MRQVQIQVAADAAAALRAIADAQGASTRMVPLGAPAHDHLVVLEIANDRLDDLVRAVSRAGIAGRWVILSEDLLALRTPDLAGIDRDLDVAPRSAMELLFGALCSLGSWRGLLIFAALSGLIAGYAMLLNASYLLIAAMLVAPLGAPVLVTVVGGACGDLPLVARGALRFVVGCGVLVAAAALLGALFGLDRPTELMEQVATLSLGSALVAVAAGIAGAESQIRSSRTTLVTATATGFLVAAALSPTSALLGFALVLGRGDYAAITSLQLALQFAGLVVGGLCAFAGRGIRPDSLLGRGASRRVRWGTAGAAAGLVAGLVAVQAIAGPAFVAADLSREAGETARAAIARIAGVDLVRLGLPLTAADVDPARAEVLFDVVVLARGPEAPARVEAEVRAAIEREVFALDPRLLPLVEVTVLAPPQSDG